MTMQPTQPKRNSFLLALLVLLTLAVFLQAVRFDFLTVDDPAYVVDNPHVRQGLTWAGVLWAWTSSTLGHWHPTTFLSYMLDMELYGLNPAGFHLTNVLLHVANVLLVFGLFRRMTGTVWRSAFVAALFAIHPLRVESVAWVAERKDVLSAFFAFLTIWAYLFWAERRNARWYLCLCAAFVLSVTSKAMMVTVPCLLLLLDYWPLGRIKHNQSFNQTAIDVGRRIFEKIPLFLISAAASAATVWASLEDHATRGLGELTVPYRIANAAVAYGTYIVKTFIPVRLGAFYPHLGDALPAWQVVASAAALVGITALALGYWRAHSYLIVGWLWFVGVIVPVSGLFQVGDQAMADRYAYVSQIGLFICMAWGVPNLLPGTQSMRRAVRFVAVIAVLLAAALAFRQTMFWKDTLTLYRHTLVVTPDNPFTRQVLGNALLMEGQAKEAAIHFETALRFDPNHADWLNKLGYARYREGQLDTAESHFRRVFELDPNHGDALNNLGLLYLDQGQPEQAERYFARVCEILPRHEGPRVNWGIALAEQERYEEAAKRFREALEIDPNSLRARFNLGAMFVEQREPQRAIEQLEYVVDKAPDHQGAQAFLQEAKGMLNEAP